jgi:hypothetical protein
MLRGWRRRVAACLQVIDGGRTTLSGRRRGPCAGLLGQWRGNYPEPVIKKIGSTPDIGPVRQFLDPFD